MQVYQGDFDTACWHLDVVYTLDRRASFKCFTPASSFTFLEPFVIL